MVYKSSLTKECYRVGELAKMLGVVNSTVHKWLVDGLIPYFTLPNSKRRKIARQDVINLLQERGILFDDTDNKRSDVIYARVSTHKQKERGDLDRQIQSLLQYCATQNPKNLKTISDVGSGLNDHRKGLMKLLSLVFEDKVDRIFVSYKDRLTRFGFNYLQAICDFHHTEIIIVSTETQDKTVEYELAEDIISIIHSFSGKLYGLRKKVREKVDKELKDE